MDVTIRKCIGKLREGVEAMIKCSTHYIIIYFSNSENFKEGCKF